MTTRKIVDTHAHLWDTAVLDYTWLAPDATHPFPGLSDMSLIPRSFVAADYQAQLERHELVAAVIVEGGADAGQSTAEVDWIADQLPELSHASRTVAHLDMSGPQAANDIDRLAARRDVVGVRQILNWDRPGSDWNFTPANLLEDPNFLNSFTLLAEASLTFDAQLWPGQFAALASLCRATSKAQVLLDHCGMPLGWATGSTTEWSEALGAFESAPNVAIKISGLGMFRRDWTIADASPILDRVYDVFGPDRIAFGSNFPVDAGTGSIASIVDRLGEWAASKGGEFEDLFFVGNGMRAYGLEHEGARS